MKKEIQEFNVMRTIAIFIILFHHLPAYCFNYYNLNFLGIHADFTFVNHLNRYFALGLFVFISGYLLDVSSSKLPSSKKLKEFFIKKYTRIIPLYLVALLLFIAFFDEVRESINGFSVLIHICGLQLFAASKYCDPVLTLWFIGLIVAYYFVFSIFAKFGTSYRRLYGLIIIMFCCFAALKGLFGFGDRRLILYFGIFAGGILCSRKKVLDKMSHYHFVYCTVGLLISIYVYVVYFYSHVFLGTTRPELFSFVAIGSLVWLNIIMMLFVMWTFFIAKYLVNKNIMKWINMISFSSYCVFLFHRPIWWLMLKVYHPDNEIARCVYLGLLGVSIIMFCSYLIQRTYDSYLHQRVVRVVSNAVFAV